MTRRVVALFGFLSLFFGFGMVQASAADGGYNPPSAVQDICDAGHGAFGAFSHHFAFSPGTDEFPAGTNWIAADAQEDGGLGHDTGPTNSGFSQFCKTQ